MELLQYPRKLVFISNVIKCQLHATFLEDYSYFFVKAFETLLWGCFLDQIYPFVSIRDLSVSRNSPLK
jgi:hypothetical protein